MYDILTIDTIDHLLGVWGYAFPEKKKIKGSEFCDCSQVLASGEPDIGGGIPMATPSK